MAVAAPKAPPVRPVQRMVALPCRVEAPEGEDSRVREFVASTELVASDRGIIRVAGWRFDRYAQNPAFLWAHQRTAPPIGKAVGWRVDLERRELRLRVEFAPADVYPFADLIRRLYSTGFMRAVSVSWDTSRWGEPTPEELALGARWVSEEQDLTECSAVPLGADPGALDVTGREAVTAAVRSGGLTTLDAAAMRKNLSGLRYWEQVAEAIDAAAAAPKPPAAPAAPRAEPEKPRKVRTAPTPERAAALLDELRTLVIRFDAIAAELSGEEPDEEDAAEPEEAPAASGSAAAPPTPARTDAGAQPPASVPDGAGAKPADAVPSPRLLELAAGYRGT